MLVIEENEVKVVENEDGSTSCISVCEGGIELIPDVAFDRKESPIKVALAIAKLYEERPQLVNEHMVEIETGSNSYYFAWVDGETFERIKRLNKSNRLWVDF